MSKASHIVTFSLFFEEIEKTPYYYKARHEAWKREQQRQIDAAVAHVEAVYGVFSRIVGIISFCVLFVFIRAVWGIAFVVEKTYDFVAWVGKRAYNKYKQLKRSLLCPLLYSLAKRVRIVR